MKNKILLGIKFIYGRVIFVFCIFLVFIFAPGIKPWEIEREETEIPLFTRAVAAMGNSYLPATTGNIKFKGIDFPKYRYTYLSIWKKQLIHSNFLIGWGWLTLHIVVLFCLFLFCEKIPPPTRFPC